MRAQVHLLSTSYLIYKSTLAQAPQAPFNFQAPWLCAKCLKALGLRINPRMHNSQTLWLPAAWETQCDGGVQQNLLSRTVAQTSPYSSEQAVNSKLEEPRNAQFLCNLLYCSQPSTSALDSLAPNDARCGDLADACIGNTTPACCGEIPAVHAHELTGSRDHQRSMHRTVVHRWSSGVNSKSPAEQLALSDSTALTIMVRHQPAPSFSALCAMFLVNCCHLQIVTDTEQI